jgi:ribonucleoside-diphosphate reductase alpha chain/ribonucleoside-triphosphate reductase
VGTPMGETPRTYVIDFPIKSGAKKTIANFSAKVQLERYFTFQELYTSHNASNTIYVKDDEWEEVEQIIWDNWDNFIGITLFPFDGGTYELAPYEDITKEQYEEMKSKMKPFDPQILTEFERYEAEKDLAGLSGCENGACPIM